MCAPHWIPRPNIFECSVVVLGTLRWSRQSHAPVSLLNAGAPDVVLLRPRPSLRRHLPERLVHSDAQGAHARRGVHVRARVGASRRGVTQ